MRTRTAAGVMALATWAVGALQPGSAAACICGGETEFIWPSDGDRVPPGAAIIGRGWGADPVVRDWLGVPVVDAPGEWLGEGRSPSLCQAPLTVYRPVKALQPGETYRIADRYGETRTFHVVEGLESAAQAPRLSFGWEKNERAIEAGGSSCELIPVHYGHSYALAVDIELGGDEAVVVVARFRNACGEPAPFDRAVVVEPGSDHVEFEYYGKPLTPEEKGPPTIEHLRQLASGCVEFEILNRFGQTLATDHTCPPADASQGIRGYCPDYEPPVYEDRPTVSFDAGLPNATDAATEMAPPPVDSGAPRLPDGAGTPPPTGGVITAHEPVQHPMAQHEAEEPQVVSSGCAVSSSGQGWALGWVVTALALGSRRRRRR